METGERPPRYKRRSGPIPPFDVTDRDEKIILTVARHRFIRSNQIIDLLKAHDPTTSEQNLVRRLRHLLDGNFIRRVKIASDQTTPGTKPVIYALGNKGIDLLAAKYGFRRPKVDYTSNARTAKAPNVEHALEVTNIMVAL